MKPKRKNFIGEVGQRLELWRKSLGYERTEMAKRLGLNRSNLYRSEIGFSFPSINTLIRLHEDFDISLDWLLFDIGSMLTEEKQALAAKEKQTKELVNKQPNIGELLAAMEQDNVLLHEVMLYFYKYKQNRQTQNPNPAHDKKEN